MDISILEEIGLTKSEISVYLALLELGSSATGKIVEKSKASSSKIYEILDRLIQKGLASHVIKSGVKYFEAAAPERILDYMNERESHLKEQKKKLKHIIPELDMKQKLSKYKNEATVYRGMKGVETAFYSALKLMKKGDENYVMGIPKRPPHIDRFFVRFENERAKKGVRLKALFNEAARNDLQAQPGNAPLTEISSPLKPLLLPSISSRTG